MHCLRFHALQLPIQCLIATTRQRLQKRLRLHQFVPANLHQQRRLLLRLRQRQPVWLRQQLHQQLIQQRQQKRCLQ